MSDDWESVTKIGSKARGGASQRETTIKTKSALNAAQRSGAIVATDKKFSTGNQVQKGVEGSHLTKVDRSDEIIAPPKTSAQLGNAIRDRRSKDPFKMTQAQLAQKANSQANDIKNLESGQAIKNQALINKVCRILKISPKTGEPLDDK